MIEERMCACGRTHGQRGHTDGQYDGFHVQFGKMGRPIVDGKISSR
jgi:hypothetical protein